MKLASYDDGSRDGQLVVVSRDLRSAHYATHVATRLQQVLDDWNFIAPQLQDLALTLDHGKARHAFAFEPARCLAPLPRAAHWSEVAAYRTGTGRSKTAADTHGVVTHLPGDIGVGSRADVRLVDAAATAGAAFCAPGLAVLTGDVPVGAAPAQALEGVRLLMLVNAWSCAPLTGKASKAVTIGAGLRWPVACSPVVVTPDELGAAWVGGRVHLPLQWSLDEGAIETVDVSEDMALHLGQLMATLARVRPLQAGSVIGTGPIPACADWQGEGLKDGQTVRLDLRDASGESLFGAIEQSVLVPE